jgi:threonine/homoserine/homoserine lactone efflux protein
MAGSVAGQMVVMSGIFMAMTFAVFIVYGAFAALIGARILQSETILKWMRRTVAAAFAGFGLRLALIDR